MMTEEIFRHDGYQFEFEAKVVSTDGELVILNRTAFYPGGGGQVCDIGTLNGIAVTEAYYDKKGDVVHRTPGHGLKVGEDVWGSVDWERRFDLMMGHTGEHILFGSLRKEVPDLEISKIFISPESKYVIVDKDIGWDVIRDALRTANKAIRENLTVSKVMMDRDDPDIEEKVRIKLDSIPEGEAVSVVAIGDFDYSACSGIHVMETLELGMIFVDRKVSAGKDGVAIHFKVGSEASDTAMELADVCLRTVEVADSKPEDLVKAVANMRNEVISSRASLKELSEMIFSSLEPEDVNGVPVYAASIPGADRKVMSEHAERIKESGGVAIFVSAGESVSVMLASGSADVDCRKILSDSLEKFGGRGGGKADFAQGGVPDPSKASELEEDLIKGVTIALS